MNIEFLPSSGQQRNISQRLIESLNSCQSVKGSIAFWTLDIEALGGSLLQALLKPGSEMCVDMQWPTDYTKLNHFYEEIQENDFPPVLYICLRKNKNNTGSGQAGLLHTKLLLFDLGEGLWEIWVGSHNFTHKALDGTNLEAGFCVFGHEREDQFRKLLRQVQNYLLYIKELCEPFDPDQIDYYELLRGKVNEEELKNRLRQELSQEFFVDDITIQRILTLRSESAHSLAGQTIILLGNLSEELSYLKHRNRGGSLVLLRVLDAQTRIEYSYEARLRAFDTIDNLFSKNVSFNARRWAERHTAYKGQEIEPPYLMPEKDVNRSLIENNKYYVNVEVMKLIKSKIIRYYTYPETDMKKLWRKVRETPTPNQPNFSDSEWIRNRTPSFPEHWVPVGDAELLTSFDRVEWGDYFEDGLLEKRMVVKGKPKG